MTVYCKFNVVHYSSLFQYFFFISMVPTLVENFCVLVCLLFFGNTIMMIMIEIQYKADPTSKGSMDFLPETDP